MSKIRQNIAKRKIINDPVHGFIHIPENLLLEIVEHPYFQRLRRIKQLGLTSLVYPGALHTRFQHSLGAMHLMQEALEVLKYKGTPVTKEEENAALSAILLHDIGHGPFSHTLENSIVNGINHEKISSLVLQLLNKQLDGTLEMAIAIFSKQYPKKFLSQLVSGQLDVDRLDYLTRDSFFTGVSEGVIGTERIIKMLDVVDNQLVAEEKAIYSLEKFLVARRIMYWQVYLHKTVLAAENMLILTLKRAKHLVQSGVKLDGASGLLFFLKNGFDENDFLTNPEVLETFLRLDDYDVIASIKEWTKSQDPVLRFLSNSLIYRRLYRCEMRLEPFEYFFIENIQKQVMKSFGVEDKDRPYFVVTGSTSAYTYNTHLDSINIVTKEGKIKDLQTLSRQLNIALLAKPVVKYFLCYPKDLLPGKGDLS